jgi:hypothetical protein
MTNQPDETYDDGFMKRLLQRSRRIAMVGASANSARPSWFVMKYLMARGFTIIPVNPGLSGQTLHGVPVVATLKDAPGVIDMVDIFRTPEAAADVVDEALALPTPPRAIWMQLGVRNAAAAQKARDAGLDVVMNRCPKIEYARLSGEIGWNGVNSKILTSRKPTLMPGFQKFSVASDDN